MHARHVLARRFTAAWLDWTDHRPRGEAELALAKLRHWTRLRGAVERSMEITPPAADLLPVVNVTDDGGAQIAVPVPTAIRRDLDALPYRIHLDARIGHSFGILAFAARDPDPELQQIGREALFTTGRALAPLASFGSQALEHFHLVLSPGAWQDYQLAAVESGHTAPRLLAAVAVRHWAESLTPFPGPAALGSGRMMHAA
jgi:hypothetical protein